MNCTKRIRITLPLLVFILGLCAGVSGQARAQCILANPSFEIDGSGGSVFGGWEQFGNAGSVSMASHGSQAARVTGPDNGSWDVSAFWQRLDSEPGEQWRAVGRVRHSESNPLSGPCAAIVNIEWRGSDGGLIDYESFAVADAGTPAGQYLDFELLSSPAPSGTAAIHYLLGVLQAPGEASPDVYYDAVNIFSTSSPTMEEMQWNDFPGGRTLDFAGRTWRVKGPGYYGPGPNVFSDDPEAVWVDAQGQLHLTLSNQGGPWASTEVVLEDALGYGDYVVTTVGRLDLLDIRAVLGIFLWQYGPCWDEAFLWWNPWNEIDIEYSRWGNASNAPAQFVAQPYYWPGNLDRFTVTFQEGEVASHAMRWLADRVEYRVWRGGPEDESPQTMIHSWTYAGPHIPRPEMPRMHLNLWKLEGTPAADQEVVFQDFVFVPEGAVSDVESAETRPSAASNAWLLPAEPNPFHSSVTIRFGLAREAAVDLAVFSVDGRRVRTLAREALDAGSHATRWDGSDEAGRPLASGIYLVRLSGDGVRDTRRIVLLR